VQLFVGTVLAIKGRGIARSVLVRRIVQGEGVERIFPLHSPRVKDIAIARRGNVRQARLYYLRDRVGKGTRVNELLGEKVRREKDRESADREAADDAAQARSAASEAPDAETETVQV
jgi:large subunit ribosomal protein L19